MSLLFANKFSSQTSLGALETKIGNRWPLLLALGSGWIVAGFVVLRFDNATVAVVSVVFGVMLLAAAAGELFQAMMTAGGWRLWHTIFAALLVVAAVIAFTNPGGTFESLAMVTSLYFIIIGTFDVFSSLFVVGSHPGWWLQLLSGIAQLVLGFLASTSYRDSVVVLVTYVSVSALFRGLSEIGAAFTMRSLAHAGSAIRADVAPTNSI